MTKPIYIDDHGADGCKRAASATMMPSFAPCCQEL